MTSKLLFGYDRLSGNRPFPPLCLNRSAEGEREEEGGREGWFLGFESELKAGIITSAAERACPLWYGQKNTALCWPAQHQLSVPHGTLESTFQKTFNMLKVFESLHSGIDLLLILEQYYNSDYNNDDTAALVHFTPQGALF